QVNAHVEGLGPSKRVVLWDTALKKLDPRELDYLFAHELGHYALEGGLLDRLTPVVGTLFFFWLLARGVTWSIARFGSRWGIASIHDLGATAVICLVLITILTLSAPLLLAMSRARERRADEFALKVIAGIVDDPAQVAAHALQKVGELSMEDPDPPLLA